MEKKKTVTSPAAAWPFPEGSSPSRVKPKKIIKTAPVKSAATDQKQNQVAVHKVVATLANVELAKAKSALTLDLSANNSKLGTLEIGQGSVYWTGRGRQKSKRISWTKFAEMMNELANY